MNDSKKPPQVELMKGEESLLMDHSYDGIRELDHVLPRWWLWILYGTIIFAIIYSAYYLPGFGPGQSQELATNMKDIEALRPVDHNPPGGSDQELLAAFKNPEKLKHGAEVFAGKCLACHGEKGQGVVGPNLTDDFWIHGKGTLRDVAEVVNAGVLDKGMPPWGQVLTSDELRDVVAFVHSLHGTNPPGAKPPQGEPQEFKD